MPTSSIKPSSPLVLPELAEYRRELESQGAQFPMPLVPFNSRGLLAMLPSPPRNRTGWPWSIESPVHSSPVEWPIITLVTPSFAQGQFLEETLRSVLLQNYPRLEYVVLDGGSTDESPAVIDRYRPWLSFARVARDRGQSHAINLGFSLAEGKIRGWLNSDDFLLPGTLHRIALRFMRGADLVYGDQLELDEAAGVYRLAAAKLAAARYRKFSGLLFQPSTFWSAQLHQPVWEDQQCALDYELWVRLLPGARIAYERRPLAVARQHAAAKTFHPAMARRWAEDAARNGQAHPELYVPSPCLDREYALVQRAVRRWRRRGVRRSCAELRASLQWDAPIIPAP